MHASVEFTGRLYPRTGSLCMSAALTRHVKFPMVYCSNLIPLVYPQFYYVAVVCRSRWGKKKFGSCFSQISLRLLGKKIPRFTASPLRSTVLQQTRLVLQERKKRGWAFLQMHGLGCLHTVGKYKYWAAPPTHQYGRKRNLNHPESRFRTFRVN